MLADVFWHAALLLHSDVAPLYAHAASLLAQLVALRPLDDPALLRALRVPRVALVAPLWCGGATPISRAPLHGLIVDRRLLRARRLEPARDARAHDERSGVRQLRAAVRHLGHDLDARAPQLLRGRRRHRRRARLGRRRLEVGRERGEQLVEQREEARAARAEGVVRGRRRDGRLRAGAGCLAVLSTEYILHSSNAATVATSALESRQRSTLLQPTR